EADQTLTIVTICFLSALASILTIGGNVMVIVSFVINRALRTVNNYLILSLAAADLVIGVVSMNLFTVFIVSGSWKLGAVLCDVWLALDYVASNASVMNLLIICLDRYYSVTKPVEYRNQRTPKRFITAIIGAWSISFILWAPWVLFWQFIVNKRTVPEDNCYVQFIKDSKPMAVITAIGAFYLPATVMCVLYWKVYIGIKNRRNKLASVAQVITGTLRSFNFNAFRKLLRMKEIKVAKDNSIISGSEDEHQSNSSDGHYSSDLPLSPHNVLKNYDVGNDNVEPLRSTSSDVVNGKQTLVAVVRQRHGYIEEKVATTNIDKNTISEFENFDSTNGSLVLENNQRKISTNSTKVKNKRRKLPSIPKEASPMTPLTNKFLESRLKLQVVKKKLQSLNKETKAARLLASILAAFILLWLPYNIMALVEAFCPLAEKCIPDLAWNFGYWFCYLNSTLNPVCYAMCNKNFQQTFKFLLSMKWIKPENRRYRAP
uniref:G-protein coupled receptors family 1 profile domain-containing protein n=1 Tax=Ciona savignyi TaxID=51511 RepID=H2ZNY9_CIOSA